MQHRSSTKLKTLVKNEPTASNHEKEDEMMDNLLREDAKSFKTQHLNFEKFKTDKPRCLCEICDLDMDFMFKILKF